MQWLRAVTSHAPNLKLPRRTSVTPRVAGWYTNAAIAKFQNALFQNIVEPTARTSPQQAVEIRLVRSRAIALFNSAKEYLPVPIIRRCAYEDLARVMADPRLAPTAPKCSGPDPYYRIRNRLFETTALWTTSTPSTARHTPCSRPSHM